MTQDDSLLPNVLQLSTNYNITLAKTTAVPLLKNNWRQIWESYWFSLGLFTLIWESYWLTSKMKPLERLDFFLSRLSFNTSHKYTWRYHYRWLEIPFDVLIAIRKNEFTLWVINLLASKAGAEQTRQRSRKSSFDRECAIAYPCSQSRGGTRGWRSRGEDKATQKVLNNHMLMQAYTLRRYVKDRSLEDWVSRRKLIWGFSWYGRIC